VAYGMLAAVGGFFPDSAHGAFERSPRSSVIRSLDVTTSGGTQPDAFGRPAAPEQLAWEFPRPLHAALTCPG